ncbi:MAG: MATE family efflux transporter [Clostridia bacterium]|nr:MATE family efflux transporter [Clostridia bacterium]
MQAENKMGVMNVNRLLITMALPMMVSMLIQSMYNIVDSIFVAQYSKDGLTAVSLCFPVQSLMISIAGGTGVGINSLLSRRLGEKRFELANKAAMNGVFLGVLSSIFVAIIGLLFSGKFFTFFTDTPATIEMGRQYMMICTVFSLGVFMQIVAERLLQATGKTHLSMLSQMSGAIVNIILDPIFIFGYFGVPEMGIAGAAIATVIGQWFAMVFAFVLNHHYNHEVKLSFKGFRPDGEVIADIYKVGVPAIIMQSITSIMTVGMNKILADDMAISVLGIYFKINSFIFMPVFGLTNALIPIFSYNFGARKKERIYGAMRTGMIISMVIMAIGTALVIAFPELFLKMFDADAAMFAMGVPALRIIPIGFIFAGYCIIIISLLQAIGAPNVSMLISILRQLVVILPAAFVLKLLFGFPAVWAAIPLAEMVATVLCVIFFKRVCKPKIDVL